MKVMITGANGFVGRSLCEALACREQSVVSVTRSSISDVIPNIFNFQIGSVSGDTDWQQGLQGCDTVVHLAARVHLMTDTAADPLLEFRRVNVDGTLKLARQAMEIGIRRFIFISSIKVNGEFTRFGQKFTVDDHPAPQDAYAISKYEAELGLRELAENTGMEVVILRPPLLYGPGVKANFLVMMQWLARGIPLPFGAIHNKRSLLALDNLVDLIVTCLDHPAAVNQTFLVGDGDDLSTTELLRRMALALGKPARLVPVPPWILQFIATLLGKKALMQRLCGSLLIDISKTKEVLGWEPPITVDEGLRRTIVGMACNKRQ